jgi:hypothetical protein
MDYVAGSMIADAPVPVPGTPSGSAPVTLLKIADAPVPVPSAPPVPLPKTPPYGPDGTLSRSRPPLVMFGSIRVPGQPWLAHLVAGTVSQAPCTPLGSSPRSPIQCDHRVEEGLAKSWNSIRGEAMIENESRVELNIAAFDRFLFEIRARRQHQASKRPSPGTPPKASQKRLAADIHAGPHLEGSVNASSTHVAPEIEIVD